MAQYITGIKSIGEYVVGLYDASAFGQYDFSLMPSCLELPCNNVLVDSTGNIQYTPNDLYFEYLKIDAVTYYEPERHDATKHFLLNSEPIKLLNGESAYIGLRIVSQKKLEQKIYSYEEYNNIKIEYVFDYCNADGTTKYGGYNISYENVSNVAIASETNTTNFLYFCKEIHSNDLQIAVGVYTYPVDGESIRIFISLDDFLNGTYTAHGPNGASTLDINFNDLSSQPAFSVSSQGGGTYDTSSDNIGLPSLPEISVVETGLYTIYCPSIPMLRGFSDWLWSTDLLDKLWIDPLQLIVGLYISPLRPSNIGDVAEIKIGGRNTGVSAPLLLNEYEYFNFGQLDIAEFYGNFLDYQSKVILYLPYVGYKEIDIKEFMGGVIKLDYLINFSTGICIAFVTAIRGKLNSVMYQFEGNIYSEVPLTSQNASNLVSTLVNMSVSSVVGFASGNPLTMTTGLVSSATNLLTTNKEFQRSGSLSLNAGYLSVQKAYIIFTRPVQALSEGFRRDRGYTSNIYKKLSELQGFTKVLYCDLSNISCTDEERTRLDEMLRDGVYF